MLRSSGYSTPAVFILTTTHPQLLDRMSIGESFGRFHLVGFVDSSNPKVRNPFLTSQPPVFARAHPPAATLTDSHSRRICAWPCSIRNSDTRVWNVWNIVPILRQHRARPCLGNSLGVQLYTTSEYANLGSPDWPFMSLHEPPCYLYIGSL